MCVCVLARRLCLQRRTTQVSVSLSEHQCLRLRPSRTGCTPCPFVRRLSFWLLPAPLMTAWQYFSHRTLWSCAVAIPHGRDHHYCSRMPRASPTLLDSNGAISAVGAFQPMGEQGVQPMGCMCCSLATRRREQWLWWGLAKIEQFERAMALAGGIGTLALRSAASVDSRLPDEYIRTVRALSLKDASAEKPPPPLPPPPPLAPPPPSASTRFTDAQAQLSDLRGSDSASYIDVGPISEAELIVLLRSGYFQRVPQPDGRYVHFTKEDFRFLILSRRSLPGTQSGWPRQQ